MRIGELCQATGVAIGTIRYYEKERLLFAPDRADNGYRNYGSAHLERLSFIRQCRTLDLTLGEIRLLLHFKDSPAENCGDVNTMLGTHIVHVAARIRELRVLEKQLKSLRERCHEGQDAAHCGILNELSQPSLHGAINRGRHVRGAHGNVRTRKI